MNRSTSFVLLLAAAAPSCAYVRDRARDLTRVVEFDAGPSTGFAAHFGLSHVAEAGLGWYSGTHVGLREGSLVEVDEERAEFGIPFLYLHEVQQRVRVGHIPGRATARMLAPGYERFPLQWFTGQLTDRDPFDFHAGFNFALFGANLSLKPLAMLDFLAGFVGVDFRQNDLSRLAVADVLPDLHSADALVRRRAVARLEWMTGIHWPDYQTPPKRELFLEGERRVLAEIEAELTGMPVGRTRSQVNAPAPAEAAPASAKRMPPPMEAAPASRPSNGAK